MYDSGEGWRRFKAAKREIDGVSTNCSIPRQAETQNISYSTERGRVFIFTTVGATSLLCTLYHTAYVHIVIFRSNKRRRHRCELVLTRQTKSFSQSDKPIPTQHSNNREANNRVTYRATIPLRPMASRQLFKSGRSSSVTPHSLINLQLRSRGGEIVYTRS